MKLKDILGRVEPRDRRKTLALWVKCATAEEIKQTGLASGVTVSDEEANFLLELKTRGMDRTRELQDDELDNVSGGGCGKKEPEAYHRMSLGELQEMWRSSDQRFADYLLDEEDYDRFFQYY